MKYTNKKELEKIFETKEATFIEPEKSIATENSNLKLPLIESLVEDPESEAIEQPETQIKQGIDSICFIMPKTSKFLRKILPIN